MHTCDLIELAAVVATHGRAFIEGAGRLSSTSLEQYWTASKCRLDRWSRSLKKFSNDSAPEFSSAQAVIEEILLSEILTRVWSGVLSAHDKRHRGNEGEPIARSVLLGHLEARHRALALLVNRPAVGANTIDELNRLRRRAERWIDLLIGVVLGDGDETNDFAIDPDRAREFAADFRERRHATGEQQAWQLTLVSLRTAFHKSRERESPNAESNGQIAAAIVACFSPELFDATGVLRSLWIVRLTNTTNDAQGMLDELVRMEIEPVGVSNRPRRF